MLKVLGPEKYEYFFDKWLEYFFTDKDAEFFASKGLNCLRLPFNYRHFEDDMNPRVLKTEGFKHLDRVVDLVRPVPCLYRSIADIFSCSAQSTRSTQFWTSTPCQADRIQTGTLTT